MNLLLILLFNLLACVQSYVTTITYKGNITGFQIRSNKYGDHIRYYGIPYAVVDEQNPFGAPKETPHYTEQFIANDSSIICPQLNRATSEVIGEIDCLRLNIYVPRSADHLFPAPVLLWFRGEESDTDFDGKYLAKHDIIVVVANYRLGPYGFLCLDDPTVPGNQGLKDQHAALVWVSQNIPSFGGDRNKITIAGQGVSVDLHLYSKMHKMFDKAIIHSGSSFGEDMYIHGNNQAAIKIANHLGYNTTVSRVAVYILSRINASEVIKTVAKLNLKFSPCVEKKFRNVSNFVVQDAFHLGNDVNNKISSTKIMIGYTSNEKYETFANKSDQDFRTMQDIFYEKLASNYLLHTKKLKNLARIVQSFYLGPKNIDKDAAIEISNFLSDVNINYGTELSISRYISQFGPMAVYKWLFSYTGDRNKTTDEASNSEEIKYLFGSRGQNFTNGQEIIMDKMTAMWANFVKYGNPTPIYRNMKLLPVDWYSVTDDIIGRPYMNIDSKLNLDYQVYHSRIAFWDLFFTNYVKYSKLSSQEQINN